MSRLEGGGAKHDFSIGQRMNERSNNNDIINDADVFRRSMNSALSTHRQTFTNTGSSTDARSKSVSFERQTGILVIPIQWRKKMLFNNQHGKILLQSNFMQLIHSVTLRDLDWFLFLPNFPRCSWASIIVL